MLTCTMLDLMQLQNLSNGLDQRGFPTLFFSCCSAERQREGKSMALENENLRWVVTNCDFLIF